MQPTERMREEDEGDILQYIFGEKSFAGMWWSEETAPSDFPYIGKFWWRPILREYLSLKRREWVGEALDRIKLSPPREGVNPTGCHGWKAAYASVERQKNQILSELEPKEGE